MSYRIPDLLTTPSATAPSLSEFYLPSAASEVSDKGWQPIDSPAHSKLLESQSRFLHVVEQGAVLRRAGSRVLITKKKTVLLEVPATKLQGVLLYGNVQVSSQCVRNLLEEGVWLSFLSRNGSYKGRLQPPVERGGKLRLRQWERSRDAEFCLGFGRAVVRGKILAQKQVAAAYCKNYLAETLGESHKTLSESLERVESVLNVDELRGVEGNASRSYFDLFRRCNRSEMPFESREKRGAADPINGLLNFGYTLMTRELEGLLEAAGLDPTVGFYHQPDGDRPSLACDWVEEFRHCVVDRLVLKLINNGVLKIADFEDRKEKGGIRMTEEGVRRFLRAYERVMVGSKEDDEALTFTGYRGTFLRQLAELLDCLSGQSVYRTHLEK